MRTYTFLVEKRTKQGKKVKEHVLNSTQWLKKEKGKCKIVFVALVDQADLEFRDL